MGAREFNRRYARGSAPGYQDTRKIPTGRELRARAFDAEGDAFKRADELADTTDWILFANAPVDPEGQWQYVLVSWGKG
jgi:hypothetical protein